MTLVYMNEGDYVDLEDAKPLNDTIFHMQGKRWCGPQDLYDLVSALASIFGEESCGLSAAEWAEQSTVTQ